jgi:hypothetical protein
MGSLFHRIFSSVQRESVARELQGHALPDHDPRPQ